MEKYAKNIFSIIFTVLLCTVGSITCRAAVINVHGPSQVASGEQFQLQYTVNTTEVSGFRLGSIPDAFDVLIGPSTSTQQSFSMVNGNMKHTSSVTYTYVLMAKEKGTFVIPAARATVNGKPATSQALRINVSGKSNASSQQHRNSTRLDRAGALIRSNDLFIKVTANKKRVYEQEPVLLTYKVYTQVELTQLQGKMPDLNGFHTQEVQLPQQKSYHVENVNGKSYNCVTWSQYVMFPQLTGTLEIPSITFNGIVLQQNANVDPFEALFNGGSGYVEVKKAIKAPSVSIHVDPLPTKPANFSGGVGTFTISSSIDKATVKAGDPVNVRVVVSGNGNMKLLKQPEINLPKDFDKYDAKVTDKTKLSENGVTGNMIYDFLIVPHNMGKYVIPSVSFVYFSTTEKKYKTIATQPIELNVEKGNGRGSDVSDYSKQNDNDIHDIIKNNPKTDNVEESIFGSLSYILINTLVFVVFIILVILFRKRAIALTDTVALREKKANKVAAKRLRNAAKLLTSNNSSQFFDEIMRAIWGYISDKFAMPVEQLSRSNIAEKLTERNVSPEVIQSLIEAIDESEYARYAPGDSLGNMQKTYDKATKAIMTIEKNIK